MNLAEMLQRPAWMAEANCRGMDPEMFYVERGDSAGLKAARAVCRACDVQAECLAYAVNNGEKFGVWGGLSEKQRRTIRRDYGVSEARCGTHAGYQRHRRDGETPCLACREANNAYSRERHRARGAA